MRSQLILLVMLCLLAGTITKANAQEVWGFGANNIAPVESNNIGDWNQLYMYGNSYIGPMPGADPGIGPVPTPVVVPQAVSQAYSPVITQSAILPFDVTVQNGLNALNTNYIRNFAGMLDDTPFYYEGPDTVVVNKNKRRTLEKGTLAVDTSGKSQDIYTRIGKVHIKPDTTCELRDNGEAVKIAVIGGRNPNGVNVIADNGEIMPLSTGELFTVQTGDLFISAEGKETVSGKIVFNGRQAEKRAFNVREYVSRDVTVAGVNLHLGLNHPAQRKRFHEHITQAAGRETTHAAQSRPVDIMGVMPLPIQSAYQPWLMTKGSVVNGTQSNILNLSSGSVFGQAPQSLTVKTPLAHVYTSKGTVLAIDSKEGAVRVKVCAGTGNTFVISGKTKISLMPGHEALVTSGKPSDSEARPADGIGRRRVKTYSLDDKTSITLADYDTLAFLLNSPYPQQLRSTDTKESKAVLEKMMKATAAISYVTGRKGNYYSEK